MKQMLRRILQGGRGFSVFFAVLAVSVLLLPQHRAQACWNPVLSECFDEHTSTLWQVWSNGTNRWDIENRYYDIHMCQTDAHACWILGYPHTNDPAFTPYPPNFDTYLTWGPVNLTGAQAGAVSFWLLNRSEPAHDSIFWGASLSRQLTNQNMMWAGSYSGDMESDWELKYVDFAHLRTPAGDSISYIGQSAVYVFWRFRSDGNENPPSHVPLRFGAIIDNVSIAVDNGGADLQAQPAILLRPDGTPWVVPGEGDSTIARFDWTTCSGGSGNYPPFRVMGLLDDGIAVLDTVISDAMQDSSYSLLTRPWVLAADSHFVRFVLDTLNQVTESNENNNVFVLSYNVPPISHVDFRWITPSDSPAYGNQTVTLRWEAHHHPAVPAMLTFYSSTQSAGCQGTLIPGGLNRPVIDAPDSLVWSLEQFGFGIPRHVFVRWIDGQNDSCIYAPQPVVRLDVDLRQGSLVPARFYLGQNYPNPFNPTTDLDYGVTKSGHVTLKVYNLLGREVAVLVNGERSPGVYTAVFDGAKLPSGLYLYKLTTPEGVQTRKMMLMR